MEDAATPPNRPNDPTGTPQVRGAYTLTTLLGTDRGELWLADGPHGRVVVRLLPHVDPHQVLDEAFAAVRIDHPHIARVLDAGVHEGTPWVARDEAPDPWSPPSGWDALRDRLRELLGALGALDAAGMAHGRIHRDNLRLHDGRALLVDPVGRGAARDDLVALGKAMGAPPDDAPPPFAGWLADLKGGRFERSVDAARGLAAIDPTTPAALPVRPPVGLGLLPIRPPPLRGRDRERQVLDQAVEKGRQRTQVVVVCSTPGMGSSRLLEATAQRAHRRGHHTAFRADSLDRLVPDGHPELVRALTHAEGSDVSRYAKLRRLVRTEARQRTPLVVLEDAHLHPQHLPFALAWLERGTPGVVLVDVDARSLDRPQLQRAQAELVQAGATLLELPPVAEDELVAALTELLPDHDDIARAAAALAEGSPMRAHLAMMSLTKTSELPLDADPWWSWLELALHRDDDLKHLELAAILDDPIDPVEWARAGTSLGLRWSRDLPMTLRLAGIAQRRKGRWRLAHSVLRDLLRTRCREEGRWTEAHLAAARSVRGPRAEERRGQHLLEAEDPEGAAEALLASVDRVEKSGQVELEQVLDLLAQALADADHSDPRRVRLGLARMQLASESGEALELGRQVAKHGTTEDRFRVAVHMVGMLRTAAKEEQDTWVARAFALARKLGRDEATGLAWQGLASVRLARGDLPGAERALAKALKLLADPEAEVFHAELLTTLGRNDEAHGVLEQVDADNDALGARLQAAWGHDAIARDEPWRALLHYRASEELAERGGLPADDPSWHVAKTLALLGRYDDAQQRFERLAEAMAGPAAVAGHVGLLYVAAHRDEAATVASQLEWLTDHAEPLPDPAAARLLAEVADRVDAGTADRVRAVAGRCGGIG